MSKFWETKIMVTVLSKDNEPYEFNNLTDLAYDIQYNCSGAIDIVSQEELTPENMIIACFGQNTDPEFFGLDYEDDE